MLLGQLVFSLILIALLPLTSHAYVRSAQNIYFLTIAKKGFPAYCLYELQDAPRENQKSYRSTLTQRHPNLLYASKGRTHENFQDLLKAAKNRSRIPIIRGTRNDYAMTTAAILEAGDRYQYEAFEQLDASGIPFTVSDVDLLAEQIAPTAHLDFSDARPVHDYYLPQYALHGRIEHFQFHDSANYEELSKKKAQYLRTYPQSGYPSDFDRVSKSAFEDYLILMSDVLYRNRTRNIRLELVAIEHKIKKHFSAYRKKDLIEVIKGPRITAFELMDAHQINPLDKLLAKKDKLILELLPRERNWIERGTIRTEIIEDMKERFKRFEDKQLSPCPLIPELN